LVFYPKVRNRLRKKMAVFWVVAPCSLVEVYRRFRGASIIRVMEAASTSETLVNIYQTTWCNNPEDSHPHNRSCENLKSHRLRMFKNRVLRTFGPKQEEVTGCWEKLYNEEAEVK
jgi:hypothetical protein